MGSQNTLEHTAQSSDEFDTIDQKSIETIKKNYDLNRHISTRVFGCISPYFILVCIFFLWTILITNTYNYMSIHGSNAQNHGQVLDVMNHPLSFLTKLFNSIAPVDTVSPHEMNSFDPRSKFTSVFRPLASAHCTQRYCKERSQGMSIVSYESYETSPFGVIGRGNASHVNGPNSQVDLNVPATTDDSLHIPPFNTIPLYPQPVYNYPKSPFHPFKDEYSSDPRSIPISHPSQLFNSAPSASPVSAIIRTLYPEVYDTKNYMLPFGHSFSFAMVADRDVHSKCSIETGECPGNKWFSTIQHGNLDIKVKNKAEIEEMQKNNENYQNRYPIEISLNLTSSLEISTQLNTNGRAIELSELQWYRGRFLTVCDYTGVVYTIRPMSGQIFPRFILADSNGREQRTFKSEWMTTQGSRVIIGSHGKEWVDNGEVKARGAEYVKIVDGNVYSINWHYIYLALRIAAKTPMPGYMSHEAVVFHEDLNRWIFVPRKVSSCEDYEVCDYDDEVDENRGGNIIITTPNFNIFDSLHREEAFEYKTLYEYVYSNGMLKPIENTLISPDLLKQDLPSNVVDIKITIGQSSMYLSELHPSIKHLPFDPFFNLLPAHIRFWSLGIQIVHIENDGSDHEEQQWGYGSISNIPGTKLLLGTKIFEKGDVTKTRLCVFDTDGNMYTKPCPYAGDFKFEGVEFMGIEEHF